MNQNKRSMTSITYGKDKEINLFVSMALNQLMANKI